MRVINPAASDNVQDLDRQWYPVSVDGKYHCSCGRELIKLDDETYQCAYGYPMYRLGDDEVRKDKFGQIWLKGKPH